MQRTPEPVTRLERGPRVPKMGRWTPSVGRPSRWSPAKLDKPRRDAVAEVFLSYNKDLTDGMMSVLDDEAAPWIDWMWGASDTEVVNDQTTRRALFVSFREALRQGPMAIAWDNVAFVGPWGIGRARHAVLVIGLERALRSSDFATLKAPEGEGH